MENIVWNRPHDDELMKILEMKTGIKTQFKLNDLGFKVNGKDGPIQPPESMEKSEWSIISCHCESEIKIQFKKPVLIVGFLNGTAHHDPVASCMFFASKNIVGYCFGPRDQTAEMRLEPGEYLLETKSLNASWKHSCWAIKEAPEARPE